jgi:hypothetical protein
MVCAPGAGAVAGVGAVRCPADSKKQINIYTNKSKLITHPFSFVTLLHYSI